jgi:hypothetical protein
VRCMGWEEWGEKRQYAAGTDRQVLLRLCGTCDSLNLSKLTQSLSIRGMWLASWVVLFGVPGAPGWAVAEEVGVALPLVLAEPAPTAGLRRARPSVNADAAPPTPPAAAAVTAVAADGPVV